MTSNDLQDMGPVDYLIVEFPSSKMTGEGLPLLGELKSQGMLSEEEFAAQKRRIFGS